MLDVEELLTTLCKLGLNLTPFIRYTAGTTNYYHQIFFFSRGTIQPLASVQHLFDTSMEFQKLKFKSVPEPALFLKMPRSNGELQHCRLIFPNLELDLSKHCASGGKFSTRMELRAVICLQSKHYTAYVRNIQTKEWCYFNDLGPSVHTLDGFEVLIQKLTSQRSSSAEFYHRSLYDVTSGAHVCIYLPRPNGGPNYDDGESE
jgi:hypothetical protein